MTTRTGSEVAGRAAPAAMDGQRPASLRGWQLAAGLIAAAGGATVIAGCLLPWATTFAGLISFPGIDGTNGRLLAAGGAVAVVAGLWHVLRGGPRSRWIAGLAGFAAGVGSILLLMRLQASLQSLGSDAMVVLRGGPGLWVTAAGSAAAFATVFLPSSQQQVFRARPAEGGGFRAWAADRQSAGSRRRLQLGLGLIWLLDAALQFQPALFGPGFVTHVIAPAAMGSPAAVAGSADAAGQVILTHPAVFNGAFATVQLMLAAGLLWRPATRAALAGTMIWGLAVWWFGESFGGLLAGTASPLTGAPGAALLYVLLAALAWPPRPAPGRVTGREPLARGSILRRAGSTAAWLAVWGGLAVLLLQPQVRRPGAIGAAIGAQAAGHDWLADTDRAAAGLLRGAGGVPVLVLVGLFAVIAIAVLVPAAISLPLLALAAVLALAIWVVGENFGGLTSGTATDPNTGPLLLLLIAAYWPPRGQPAGGQDRGSARPSGSVRPLSSETSAPLPARTG